MKNNMEKKYNKYIKDGKVAVLVSPGYGAGWSTWNEEYREELLFDEEIVEKLLEKKPIDKFIEDKYGDRIYTGGASRLKIEWVRVGARFHIKEYDGYETLEHLDDENFYTIA